MPINYHDLIAKRTRLFDDLPDTLLLVAGRYDQAHPASGINWFCRDSIWGSTFRRRWIRGQEISVLSVSIARLLNFISAKRIIAGVDFAHICLHVSTWPAA